MSLTPLPHILCRKVHLWCTFFALLAMNGPLPAELKFRKNTGNQKVIGLTPIGSIPEFFLWAAYITDYWNLVLQFANVWVACTSPRVFSTSPKTENLISIGYSSCVIWLPQKTFIWPSGKLRTELFSLIAKSTIPRLSDTTFFAHCWLKKTSFTCIL